MIYALGVKLLWSFFTYVELLTSLFAICYSAWRPWLIVFKCVPIEQSELYAGGAPTPTKGYRCARKTPVTETRPSLCVHIKEHHRQRELCHLCGVEGICEGGVSS